MSGGVDSMVMLHLLREAGYRIGVAHCNFQLRGADADADEEFVGDVCRDFSVPFHVRRFDTERHAAANGISIQMAARTLRYNFFGEVAGAEGYHVIATAHHFSDVIESVLLNLVRGTGIDGIRGIAPRKGNIIRPLLFATRQMIVDFAKERGIRWSEDSSNSSDDYQRNFLRHNVVPKLVEMNPGFEDSFRQTHERLLGARAFSQAYIDGIRSAAVLSHDDSLTVDIRRIRNSEAPAVLLWELIKDKGFRYDQCVKIAEDHQPGKVFFSDTHRLVVDRSKYILHKIQTSSFVPQPIANGEGVAANGPFMLVLSECTRADFVMHRDSSLAQLDADRLSFPLLWRRWQAGDYFAPLGMRSEKKVSDFLIDLKIPFNEKADITVLECNGEIVWVVGHRINERYKVTDDTKRITVIELKQTSD